MTVKNPGRLSFLDIFCLGVNATIGSGIYIFPGILAGLIGPVSILAFLVCGLLLLPVALCYGELAGMFRGNGASAHYAHEAFGGTVGFGVGLIAWATSVLSWAAVASALGQSLDFIHPVFDAPGVPQGAAVFILAVFSLINFLGVKIGARTVNALTLAKIIPLAFFVLLALPKAEPARFVPFTMGGGDFGYAVFLALWAVQGFEVAPIPAAETSDPRRDIPWAVVGALLASTAFYVLIQTAAFGSFPGLGEAKEKPLSAAAAFALGPAWGKFLGAAGVVSMLGFSAGSALGAPRYLSALGSASLKSLRLDAVSAGRGTPARAILATFLCTSGIILFLDLSKQIDLANLAVVIQYVAVALSLLRLRASRPDAERPFRLPAASWVAGSAILISLWLISQVTIKEWSAAVLLLAAGYCLRGVLDRKAA